MVGTLQLNFKDYLFACVAAAVSLAAQGKGARIYVSVK
jgi:hypothetical protein